MIKIKNQRHIEDEACKTLNSELLLKDLLSTLLNDEILMDSASDSYEMATADLSKLLMLRNAEGLKIFLDFNNLFPVDERLQHFMFLTSLASTLKKKLEGYWQGFYFAEPENDLHCRVLKSYEIRGKYTPVTRVYISCAENLSLFYPDGANSQALEKVSQTDKVRLELGSIEMDFATFLKLKEGMELECELPEIFKAKLSISNNSVAGVQAVLENKKLKLKVESLATF